MTPRKLNHYVITGLLGKGGMGEVYRATDEKLGREVALKILPANLAADEVRLKRFQREARTVAALNHPHIVTLYSVEEDGDVPFLTMELVDGDNLHQVLAREPLPLDKTVAVGIAVAEALADAHARGVVHRDLKPANIMIDKHGRVKVLDFGMARLADHEDTAEKQTMAEGPLTVAGSLLGTAPYMSPEQARGEVADHRADIWALGVILYEMMTGENPFSAGNLPATLHRINSVEPSPLSSVSAASSPELDAVVGRALTKDREDRYQRATDLANDLKALQAGQQEISTSAPTVSREPAKTLPHLAVLPFTGLKPDPDTDYLGFALADQVIGSLAYIKNLLIKPSSAIRRYQGQAVDLSAAARDLKVDYLLNGYYLREGETIRLNLELVRTHTDEMVWREALQVPYENVFQLQDLVSEKVVRGLEVQFPREARARAAAYVPADPAAYEYYLRSLSFPHNNEGDKLAIGMLRQSLELDGKFAAAYTALGSRLTSYGTLALQGPGIYQEIESCYQSALAHDSENLQALGGLAGLSKDIGKTYEALGLVKRMMRINPNHARSHAVHSGVLRIAGMLDESWAAALKAISLDPGNPGFAGLAFGAFYAGRYDDAIKMFELEKDSFHSIAWIGFCKYMKGEKSEGLEMMEAAARSEPHGHLGHHFGALMAGWRGDFAAGLALAHEWEAPGNYDAEWYYNLSTAYALLGDRDGCVRTLTRSVEGGFFCPDYFANDPLLAPMRQEPAVIKLIDLARAKHEAFREFYEAQPVSDSNHG